MPNWIDLIIVVILGLFLWNGYHKGLIRQVGDLLLLVLSVFISFFFYNSLATFLSAHFSTPLLSGFLGKIAALVILWFGTQIIFFFLFGLFYRLVPEGIRDSKINKSFGAIPGLVWGAIFVTVVFLICSVTLGFFPKYQNYREALDSSLTGKTIVAQSGWFKALVVDKLGSDFGGNLTFRTVEPNSSETYTLGYKTTKVTAKPLSGEEMLILVNKERKERGLRELKMDAKLTSVAESHSRDMFAKGYFAHKSPEGKDPFARMAEAGILFIVAGENLALAPDVPAAHTGLMNSPGHRANILSPDFGKIGIGVIDGGKYGLMISQEFTN